MIRPGNSRRIMNNIPEWMKVHYRKWLTDNLDKGRLQYVVAFGLTDEQSNQLYEWELKDQNDRMDS